MKKLFFLTFIYIATLYCGLYYRETKKHPSVDPKPNRAARYDSPHMFAQLHREIRSIQKDKPGGYPPNYQWAELKKARQWASSAQARLSDESDTEIVEWKERGPVNVPGRTRGVIVDPDDASHRTWFAGSASGGIWKTTDAGASWDWLTPRLPNLATTTLAMAGSNHNIIYAGLGEGFGGLSAVRGQGLLKSTDRGQTWTVLDNTSSFADVNRIAINPRDANMVVVASNAGIFRTLNGGSSWTRVYTSDQEKNKYIQDLKATPGNFNILYATEQTSGVLKSTDAGATWALSSQGIGRHFGLFRTEIAISPVNSNYLFASAETGIQSTLYFSSNGGGFWTSVPLLLNNTTLNYMGSQGWYDNTIAADLYDPNIVYVGGIGVYKVRLSQTTETIDFVSVIIPYNNLPEFLGLARFDSGNAANGFLNAFSSDWSNNVEIRFGPNLTQKAHRFLVPKGRTSEVPDDSYTYMDYVDVPFQVWDVTQNQQLMVSFRDQDRNGQFNLLHLNTINSDATKQSREYVYISSQRYNASSPLEEIAATGGHKQHAIYMIWPILKEGKSWDPSSLPDSKLEIKMFTAKELQGTHQVTTISDPYSEYDGVNNYIGEITNSSVHPDHHNIILWKENESNRTSRMLLATDGGLFLSKVSSSPGTAEGDWSSRGHGYNTSQFYGADKRPGADEFIGGTQDNGTWMSRSGDNPATSTSIYSPAIGGDGFECLWNNLNDQLLLGSSQFGHVKRSLNGGRSWNIIDYFSNASGFPFLTRLASSRAAPDNVYSIGAEGVSRSTDFGESWALTKIKNKWTFSNIMPIKVSRKNPNIVWAGAHMSDHGSVHVSTNAGLSFSPTTSYSKVSEGNLSGVLSGLATHPRDANTAYALFSQPRSPKIVRTTDLGRTWEDISGFEGRTTSNRHFPDVAVYCLYVRSDNPNILWAGTEIGIVQSLNNGTSWSLLSSPLPNVSVWDIKEEGNHLVIATHGRGIWTVKMKNSQSGRRSPHIIEAGTSPNGKYLNLLYNLPELYDSIQVHFIYLDDSQPPQVVRLSGQKAVGLYTLSVSSVSYKKLSTKLVGYIKDVPHHSSEKIVTHFDPPDAQTSHIENFSSANMILSDSMRVGSLGDSRVLETKHPYLGRYTALIKQPVTIDDPNKIHLSYKDVALIEKTTDYVIVEASKDGVVWKPVGTRYSAASQTKWSTAMDNANLTVSEDLFVRHSYDTISAFQAGDTLLFRFRLFANHHSAGWGWAISDLRINGLVAGVEKKQDPSFLLYPNPATNHVFVQFDQSVKGPSMVTILALNGEIVHQQGLGIHEQGTHLASLNVARLKPNMYIVQWTSPQQKTLRKRLLVSR